MAKKGYVIHYQSYDGTQADIEWMKVYGCNIIEEQPGQEKLRPAWNRLLDSLEIGDILVIPKMDHILKGSRELSFFLEFCRIKGIRLISIHDKIDSGDELFPETRTSDILATVAKLPKEANAIHRSSSHVCKLKSHLNIASQACYNREERKKLVINMYKGNYAINDILKASGFKSRSSIFRILKDAGIQMQRTNRDYYPGIKKDSQE